MENNGKQGKPRSKEYPANSINQAIEFIEKFKMFPRNKSISYSVAAQEFGVKPSAKSFAYKLSSAKQFGLISTSSGTFNITELGLEFMFPTKKEEQLKVIKKQCLENSAIYRDLIESYEGRPMPDEVTLSNILVQHYGIVPTVSRKAAEVFIQSVNEAKLIISGVLDLNIDEDTSNIEAEENEVVEPTKLEEYTKPEEPIKLRKIVETYNDNEIQTDSGYESLVIPLGNRKNAILRFPSDINNKQVGFISNMIKLTLDQLCGDEK